MPISRLAMPRIHTAPIDLDWCHDPAQEAAIAALFMRQLSPRYISHSELQGERAVAPGEWRRDLPEVLRAELRETLALPPVTAASLIATAHAGDALAAIALVSVDEARRAARAFATLDDLVVDAPFQSAGVGGQLFDWVCAELRQRGIARLFLESGIGNQGAHRFFEARGCMPVSVTMLKELEA